MAERLKGNVKAAYPRSRTFGTAAVTARQRLAWMWSRESILRLLLSFVLAVALWLYVTSKQDPTQSWDFAQPLPISPLNVRQGYVVANDLPLVHIRVRADTHIVQVTSASFHTFVDLNAVGPGTHSVKVNVVPDPGISILSVTPPRVKVVVEALQTSHVPVRWHFSGKLPPGYRLGDIRVNPTTVQVQGPQSAVSAVYQAVIFVDLTGARSGIEGTYPLVAENSQNVTVNVSHLQLDPTSADINVQIAPLTSYKTLPVLVPIRGKPQAGYGVSGIVVSPAEVTASGSPSTLAGVPSLSTLPVSVSGHGAGRFSTTAALQLPSGVSGPHRVKVTIVLSPVESSTAIQIGVSPLNLSPGLVVRTVPSSVLVTVVGSAIALQSAARQMRAQLNLSGYGAGVYRLSPNIVAPKGLRVEGSYPTTVTATLQAIS